jgi:hypothetical protein
MAIDNAAGELTGLRYPSPFGVIFGLSSAVLSGSRRSFRKDSLAAIARLEPPLCLSGSEYIPSSGPALLTINHYYRPGFGAWWLAFALSASVPAEIHWVMTSALNYPGRIFGRLRTLVSRWLLPRIARVYDFTSMPAMPPAPNEVLERARAVHHAISFTRNNPLALVGLAPEGHDNLRRGLMVPPSGVGRFILHLSHLGLTIYPVAAYEHQDGFHLSFGCPYSLRLPESLPQHQIDQFVGDLVMRHIAALLPEDQRGDYR